MLDSNVMKLADIKCVTCSKVIDANKAVRFRNLSNNRLQRYGY